jgi:hypothetical protein
MKTLETWTNPAITRLKRLEAEERVRYASSRQAVVEHAAFCAARPFHSRMKVAKPRRISMGGAPVELALDE